MCRLDYRGASEATLIDMGEIDRNINTIKHDKNQ